jgi:hypothetical protein
MHLAAFAEGFGGPSSRQRKRPKCTCTRAAQQGNDARFGNSDKEFTKISE